MKKVITYGTFDMLHYGHIRLLERAKELGDYLVVSVTSEDFDKRRGKINVSQSLMERVKAVKNTGLADEIIIEEYEGQKIDDIINLGIDVFTVGSDWEGKFDYLKDYCEVIYLERTEGISSTDIRNEKSQINIGIVGDNKDFLKKVLYESSLINGLNVSSIYFEKQIDIEEDINYAKSYKELLKNNDAVYIANHPEKHFQFIKEAILNKKHVLCESPVTLSKKEYSELTKLAKENNIILMESIRTAYSTAYNRLLLLIKTGIIGKVVSIDSTCTSLKNIEEELEKNHWNSITSWGPVAMLPIFQILGTNYKSNNITSLCYDSKKDFDLFTKINFVYDNAVATIKVGKGVKSESELIISGTDGYVYVPAPWWITNYFEIRYENTNNNKKYFYDLDGNGYRNQFLNFYKSIVEKRNKSKIGDNVTSEICNVMNDYYKNKKVIK